MEAAEGPPTACRKSRGWWPLAVHIRRLFDESVGKEHAELARLGHVSRARITQIMGLLNLAPDIVEEILFLPRVEEGRDPVGEHALRSISAAVDWGTQRRRWVTVSTRQSSRPQVSGAIDRATDDSTKARLATGR